MLLIFFGQIGTGKTSVAKRVSEELGFNFIYFDKVMKLIVDKTKYYGEDGGFLLIDEEIKKVYKYMNDLARNLIKKGKNVILESMYFKEEREEAVKIAKEMKVPFVLIEVVCDEKEIKRRLEKRKKQETQTPGFKLYLEYKDIFEKEDSDHIIIDTTNKSIKESAEEVIKRLEYKN